MAKGYVYRKAKSVRPVRCPCGASRRILTRRDTPKASFHVVDIWRDSRKHYHKKLTEIYYVLEGEGHLEADDDIVPLKPGTVVLISPGTRHRAVGKLRIVNVVVPAFDESDEHFDT
jgi:mannose-6-phosphate isomerase-like protein (cupin superfamily)